MTQRLRGAAADAAFRLLPPKTQRTVRLVAELLEMPVRRAVRILIHGYNGDVAEFRSSAIYGVVQAARKNPPRHWPKMTGASDAEIVERVVGDKLIKEDRGFAEYLQDVHYIITGEERVL